MPAGKKPLTRDAVLAAAVRIADEDGLRSVTMRSVGAAVGIEAMSLYTHVTGKTDLLDGMIDIVFGEIEQPPEDLPWREWMRRRAVSARDALREHRWAIGLLESRVAPGPANLRHHDTVLGRLRAAGFTVAAAGHAYALLDSYIYGFALQEANLPALSPDSAEGAALIAAVRVDDFPHLAEFAAERVMQPGYAFADEFEIGLDLVLDGIAQLLGE